VFDNYSIISHIDRLFKFRLMMDEESRERDVDEKVNYASVVFNMSALKGNS